MEELAKKINSIQDKLSPFEKYLLCYKIANNVEYFCTDDIPLSSQSFVDTVMNNKGCCVGKSQYFRALLYMVGINACDVKIEDCRLDVILVNESVKNGADKFMDRNTSKIISSKKALNLLINKIVKNKTTSHEINLVELDDDDYGIHGIFAGDSCSSSFQNDCYVPLEGNIDTLFDFSSLYLSGKRICKSLDKLNSKDFKKMDEKKESKIYNKFYKIGEKYTKNQREDILEDDHEHYLNTMTAIEARIRLEETPLSGSISFKTINRALSKVDEIYNEYFTKHIEQESVL